MNSYNHDLKIYYLIPALDEYGFVWRKFFRWVKRGDGIKYLKRRYFSKPGPVGGVRVFYQHAIQWRKLGVFALPLMMGKYHGNFFGYDINAEPISDYDSSFDETDVVVVPEAFPYLAEHLHVKNKIMFVQNLPYRNLRPEDSGKSYKELGFSKVIYCSKYLGTLLAEGDLQQAFYVPNYLDQQFFVSEKVDFQSGRVMVMPRKSEDLLARVMERMSGYASLEFNMIDRLKQPELIKQYLQSDVYLATGFPEGFGLPALEAMACGCTVVGFDGGGAGEFMRHNETALVAEDGDIDGLVNALTKVLNDLPLKERLREAGRAQAACYTDAGTRAGLAKILLPKVEPATVLETNTKTQNKSI